MSVTAPEISELREAYREARANILQIPNELERDVGLAALRLEALHAYRELATTATGLTDATLAPLKEYASNLKGGERIESSVDALDNQVQSYASKVLKDLWAVLTTGTAVGILAVIADIVLLAAIAAESFGAFLFGAVIAGGSALIFVLRSADVASRALTQAWEASWGWASSLGVPADAALSEARRLQREMLQRVAGGGLELQRFTDRVRTRAQIVMGVAWSAVGIAVVLVVIGFAQAAMDWWDESPSNPTNELTFPSGDVGLQPAAGEGSRVQNRSA